jgi:predicted esterase
MVRAWLASVTLAVAALFGHGWSAGSLATLSRAAANASLPDPDRGTNLDTVDSPESLDEAPADWCAPGFHPVAGGGCLAMRPDRDAQPLIVYLHGRYARDASANEVDRQRRLGDHATARGFAVLALRGRLGGCGPGMSAWYCWPTSANPPAAGATVVAGWRRAIAEAQARTGARQLFLLGFSSGGYFAGIVASHGLLEVDAVAVAHAGPVEPVHPVASTPPVLLLSADSDMSQRDMIRFDQALGREHWAHDCYARPGGHELADSDIDAALTFFARAGEPVPLQPPLPLHRPARRPADAGPDAEVPASGQASPDHR